jgi:hypothetical protein
MTTDSSQVMRVLDRCLDATESRSDTLPGVAAAVARAKADPRMHDAITVLLSEGNETELLECLRRALAVRARGSCNLPHASAGHCDMGSAMRVIFMSCTNATRDTGQPDCWIAAALAELFLAAIALERSSLGTDQGRRLRNRVAHRDVAAAVTMCRSLADKKPEASGQNGPRAAEIS